MASPINQTTARRGFTCRAESLTQRERNRDLYGQRTEPNLSDVTYGTNDENLFSPISHLGFDHVE